MPTIYKCIRHQFMTQSDSETNSFEKSKQSKKQSNQKNSKQHKESKSVLKSKGSSVKHDALPQSKSKLKKQAKKPKKKPKNQPAVKQQKKKQQVETGQQKQTVCKYMLKQNRPYNLLNIFDNLHGSIKKNTLESILNELTQEEVLKSKEFGKNKLYYANQDSLPIDLSELQSQYDEVRKVESELQDELKKTAEEHKKMMCRKPIEDLENQIEEINLSISILQNKKNKAMSLCINQIQHSIVEKEQKKQISLTKEFKKRKKIVMEGINMLEQMLQKKKEEVIELVGIEL